MFRLGFTTISLVLVLGVAVSSLSDSPRKAGATAGHGAEPAMTAMSPAHQTPALPVLEDVADSLAPCAGSLTTRLPLSGLCTHGADPAPPGFEVGQSVAPMRDAIARDAAASAACEGDGSSGYRVQLLYVHGADVTSRYDQYLASFRAWAAEMDQMIRASAAETGGARSIRFVHDANCLPTVQTIQVSPAGDDSFDRTMVELKNQRLNRRDRIYLAFVDTTAAGLCGIGTAWSDDRRDGRINRNNIGPAYSRVDAGCWDGHTAAHELMHNLGGVQHSAPNSSGGFHCIDEWDLMCYQDSAQTTTRTDCPNNSRDVSRFDCNHDDYFHTDPPAASYLANHWNAANNRFLDGAPSPAVKNANSSKKANSKKNNGKNKKKRGGRSKRQ